MLPIKHFPVNWKDGMKISKEHFIALENAFTDRLRDSISLQLTNYNYGILPPVMGSDQSLDLSFNYDVVTKEIVVKVLRCRAVTPGGIRIDIAETDFPGFKKLDSQPQINYKIDSFQTLAYDIVLSVDLFARVPFGQADPEETPLRQPFIMPRYNLEIIPYPRVNKPEYGAYQLTIGRIEVEAGQPKLSTKYIPPCYSLNSYRYLVSLNDKIVKILDELELVSTKIIQKKKANGDLSELTSDTIFVTEKILFFLANIKDHYKIIIPQQPPLLAVEYCLRLARTFYLSLECCLNKYELLDHYCNWLDWNPGQFENSLSGFLALEYNHEDLFESFKKTEECYNMILSFFNQIGKMGVRDPVKNKKVYGWLIEHTKGKGSKELTVFPVKEKTDITIGRSTDTDVDLNLPDDLYISRRHAKVEVESEGNYQLKDLNSKHGTFILQRNKEWRRMVKDGFYYLNDGDVIQIGRTHLVFKTKEVAGSEEDAINMVDRLPYPKLFEVEEVKG